MEENTEAGTKTEGGVDADVREESTESARTRILAWFDQHPGQTVRVSDLHKELGLRYQNVWVAFHRMIARGMVKRAGRGVYRRNEK